LPRYILTGTPGAGKTAVLRLLEFHGHIVVDESATDVIALEAALGHEQPENDPSLIDKILTLQRQRQARAPAAETEPVFFDRSPVCTLALSRYLGFAPSRLLLDEVERIINERVYESIVFFIRNLGFAHNTAARRITFEESLAFERIHQQTYRGLGFQLIDVPPVPLMDRVACIQQTIDRLEHGPHRASPLSSDSPNRPCGSPGPQVSKVTS
jgi:predicted ATPase